MVSTIYRWSYNRVSAGAKPSPKALADLARRKATPDTRDNTGRLLGDPPPGRSALDKKLAAEARRQLGWPEEVHDLMTDDANDEEE
jgi:hypothetical protein